MRRTDIVKRGHIEEPIWCDHCRVRIAPYEKAEIAGSKVFHKHCFRKEIHEAAPDLFEDESGVVSNNPLLS